MLYKIQRENSAKIAVIYEYLRNQKYNPPTGLISGEKPIYNTI
jgi:hypothetical protein